VPESTPDDWMERELGRRPDPNRREALLHAVVEYLLEQGIHQTSLRPLAAALDTSTYTFVYHFGSKEDLVVSALGAISDRHGRAIRQLGQQPTFDELVHGYWRWSVEVDRLRTARVATDARSLVRTQPDLYRPFVEALRSDLTAAVRSALGRAGHASADAEMVVAALTGTLQELVALGDSASASATVERLLVLVD